MLLLRHHHEGYKFDSPIRVVLESELSASQAITVTGITGLGMPRYHKLERRAG